MLDETRLLALIREELRANIAPIAPVLPVAPVAPVAPVLPVADISGTVIYKLGRIESLLEEQNKGLLAHMLEDEKLFGETINRVNSLERSRSYGLGIVTILSSAIALIANFVFYLFRQHS